MDTSKLDRILERLDDKHVDAVVSELHDMARESFRLPKSTVANHAEFYDITLRYYRHHYARTISSGGMVPEDIAAGEVRHILEQVYRDRGGYEGAYRSARTGMLGGMSGVLNGMASAMRNRQVEQFKANVFYTEIDPMNYDDIVALMQQLLDRFGGYLSPAERARSPHDLARNYDTIIEELAKHLSPIRGMIERV